MNWIKRYSKFLDKIEKEKISETEDAYTFSLWTNFNHYIIEMPKKMDFSELREEAVNLKHKRQKGMEKNGFFELDPDEKLIVLIYDLAKQKAKLAKYKAKKDPTFNANFDATQFYQDYMADFYESCTSTAKF